jgi:hypothetical protein
LFPTIVANLSGDDGRGGGSIDLQRDITRRMEEIEIRGVE